MKPKNKKLPKPWDETFEGQWCIDNETGKRVLMDCRTNKIVIREEDYEDKS